MSVAARALAGLLAIGLGVVLAARGGPEPPPALKGTAAAPGFALVELFTSEGCSSCPPADRLLDALATEARKDGRRVHALAFHVDYWDYIGWKDPFGSPAHTARQRAYTHALGSSTYTPQMVVNGRREFVGSQGPKARAEVLRAVGEPATVALTATADPAEGGWTVTYETKGAPPGVQIHAALVQGGLSTKVPRGENAGRTLPHDNVVRAFATGGIPRGALRLSAPEGATATRFVVFAQDPGSMAVLAATEVTP